MIFSDNIKNCYYYGYLGMLVFFHGKGDNIFIREGIDMAATNGHLNILQWMDENKMRMMYSKEALVGAIKNGHRHIIMWFYQKCENTVINEGIDIAATCGNLEMLQWMLNNGICMVYSINAITGAVRNRHVHIIAWFHENGLDMYGYDGELKWICDRRKLDFDSEIADSVEIARKRVKTKEFEAKINSQYGNSLFGNSLSEISDSEYSDSLSEYPEFSESESSESEFSNTENEPVQKDINDAISLEMTSIYEMLGISL